MQAPLSRSRPCLLVEITAAVLRRWPAGTGSQLFEPGVGVGRHPAGEQRQHGSSQLQRSRTLLRCAVSVSTSPRYRRSPYLLTTML